MKKKKYAIMTSLPDCCYARGKYSCRCSNCEIGELLMFQYETCWFASDRFMSRCSFVYEENVKYISKEEAKKYMMAGAI